MGLRTSEEWMVFVRLYKTMRSFVPELHGPIMYANGEAWFVSTGNAVITSSAHHNDNAD